MGIKARQLFPLLVGVAFILTVKLLSSQWATSYWHQNRQIPGAALARRDVSNQLARFQAEVMSNLTSLRKDFQDFIKTGNHEKQRENGGEESETPSKIRILFLVLTAPTNVDTKAINVKNTWGKRADKILFISSKTNTTFPTVGVDVPEGRDHLTGKTVKGLTYVYENHIDDADWFMKCDDDTYVIVENLQKFLSDKDSNALVWYGHLFQAIAKQGYYSGGAGYVLSKAALKHWYNNGGRDPDVCLQDGGAEDAEVGLCMEKLGIKTTNGSDALGRNRFNAYDPDRHLFGPLYDWYEQYDVYGGKKGLDSIHEYAISFHYMDERKMILMELLLYRMKRWREHKRQHLND